MTNKKITINVLAEMTQRGLQDVEQRLTGKIDRVEQISLSILKVVENIQGRIGEVHTVARVDIPDMREKQERLEKRTEGVEKRVRV